MDRERVTHVLNRRERLHNPSIYKLLHASVVDARCNRACLATREYLGLGKTMQGQWESPFFFVQIADPQLGIYSSGIDGAEGSGGMDWSIEVERLQSAISAINKLRPK